jgi:hypothetical protein
MTSAPTIEQSNSLADLAAPRPPDEGEPPPPYPPPKPYPIPPAQPYPQPGGRRDGAEHGDWK